MKKLLVVLVFHLFAVNAFAEPIRVTMLNPGGTHWFWQMTIDFMRAAAEDLQIELEVITSDWDHFLTVEQAESVLSRPHPPDYLIIGNEKSNAGEIIQRADQAKVNTFLFSNGFVDPKDNAKYRQPRIKYTHWIGQLIPDNFSAGYQIGKSLINRALLLGLTGEDGKVPVVAIAGAHLTHASVERVRGLRAAVAEFEDKAVLLQVFSGDWTALRAEEIGRGIFRRYADVAVVWCVNDTTAFGAMDAALSAGRKPGKDVLFGGCGWHPEAIPSVRANTLTTTVGGHFMDGAWVLVLLYDYHHGRDFYQEDLQSQMVPIEHDNAEKYLRLLNRQEWHRIDFTQFSKVHNPALLKYDFSVETVLRQLQ